MFVKAKRFIGKFFKKSRSVDNKPLNPVSLIVIIIVDIFILSNVFIGLDNISRWHISPSEAYPCVSEWRNYRDDKRGGDKDYDLIASSLTSKSEQTANNRNSLNNYKDRLGDVSTICLNDAELQDKVNTPSNRSIKQNIDKKGDNISSLEQANASIRSQYDSTLLEKIAGQKSNQSINGVSAEKAKQTLAQNKAGRS